MYLQRWHGWCHMKLLPSQCVLCTPYNHAPCHFVQSHIRKAYACLAVTCHLQFWQNDRDLLLATVVTQGFTSGPGSGSWTACFPLPHIPAIALTQIHTHLRLRSLLARVHEALPCTSELAQIHTHTHTSISAHFWLQFMNRLLPHSTHVIRP